MKKSLLAMTPAERNDWYKLIQENAREYLFSIGQPLVYKKQGGIIAEYADGMVENLD